MCLRKIKLLERNKANCLVLPSHKIPVPAIFPICQLQMPSHLQTMMSILRAVIFVFSLSLYFLLGADAATEFAVPAGKMIVCSDSFANVCTAPTACNKNGHVTFDSGNNFNVGGTKQDGGYWTVNGGYTIKFPEECDVQCQGDCVCDGCEYKEVSDFAAVTPDSGVAQTISTTTTCVAAGFVIVAAAWAFVV